MTQNLSHAVMAQRHEPVTSLDLFPTPPWATRALMEELASDRMPKLWKAESVWEPAAGRTLTPIGMAGLLLPHKGKLTATGSTATAYCFRWIPPCRKRLERPGDYEARRAAAAVRGGRRVTALQTYMRGCLDSMIACNGGRPIEAYKGEGGIVKTSLDELRRAREQARRKRQRESRAAFRGQFAP